MKSDKKMTRLSQTLRHNATKEENTLWYQYLRNYPVQFRRQCIFDRYIVDFYCAKASLIVELDGSKHYEVSGLEKDKQRTSYLESLGLQVLRFSNADVNQRLSGVCQAIDHAVNARFAESNAPRKQYSNYQRG